MIRLGGRPTPGFGLGSVSGPARSVGVSALTALAGAGAGFGAVLLARHFGAPAWGTVASGAGTAIAVWATAEYLTRRVPDHRSLIRRSSQSLTGPGRFVSLVQQALTDAGFDTQGADNTWGSHTSAAASAFQTAHGMTPTGLPEPELLRALGITIPTYPNAADIASALASGLVGIAEPRDALKIMLGESGMNPAAVAHHDGKPVAGGVFGLLVTQTQNLAGMSFDDWLKLSAAQQIPYAAKFWKQITSGFHAPLPVSARDLYWLNYMPAAYVPGAADDYVFVKSDDTWLPRGSSTWKHADGFYTQNVGLDHPLVPGGPPKGYITAGDMAQAAARGAMNNPVTYAAVADALSPQNVA